MKLSPIRRQRSESENESDRHFDITKSGLILIGLIIGLGLGVYYAWLVEPVSYVKASPARFDETNKEEYIFLISQSYAANGDWQLVQERLSALDDPNIQQTVDQQLEKFLRNGETSQVMRNMSLVAQRLGVSSVAIDIFVPEAAETSTPTPPLAATPERTRFPTRTPIPTITPTSEPTATPIPKYRLLSQEQICHPDFPAPRLEVIAVDSRLEPVPGVEVIVQWNEGTDHFFTGFQLEKGAGYGDFAMDPVVNYQLLLAEGSPVIDDLRIEECGEAQGGLPGGWRLTFQNTDDPQD